MQIPERITAVPNAVFDEYLPQLTCAELKILLIIIRQTLGWEDKGERKNQDWISSSQMQEKTGCSGRAITTAIEALVRKNLISVHDQYGSLLDSPERRKGKSKLFFSLTLTCDKSPAFASLPPSLELRRTGRTGRPVDRSAKIAIPEKIGINVENKRKTGADECKTGNTSADFAEDFRKKYAALQQKMRITK